MPNFILKFSSQTLHENHPIDTVAAQSLNYQKYLYIIEKLFLAGQLKIKYVFQLKVREKIFNEFHKIYIYGNKGYLDAYTFCVCVCVPINTA